MKIAYASDIHLEFGDIELKNTENAEVLILAGDILVAKDLFYHDDVHTLGERVIKMGKSDRFHKFFEEICSEFPHVIFICGNHEHYHGDITKTYDELYDKLQRFENLHIMDKSIFELNGVTFFGGTLWTDMNKRDPITLWDMNKWMNDFKIIKNSSRMISGYKPAKFTPEDSIDEHQDFIIKLEKVLKEQETVIVVGHHAPSPLSIHEDYKHDTIMNGAYCSRLDEFIINNPKIKAWFHGHVHNEFDYMIGSTRILCNPRGYINHEKRANDFQLKYIVI